MNRKNIAFSLLAALALPLAGCGLFEPAPPKPVDRLAQKAAIAAEEAAQQTLQAWEIENIEKRRVLMGQPGLILYVVFFNDTGQPVDYFVANGKCTSSNKRLTRSQEFVRGDGGEYYRDFVMEAAGEDGTHGSSDDYIYCFTTDGKYKQWNGDYYASNYPIELTIKPLVIDVRKPGQSGIQSQQ